MDQRAIEEYHSRVMRNIETFGVHLTYVFGENGVPPFTYTVGCSLIEKPELLICGLSAGIAGQLANRYFERVQSGEEFHDGDVSSGFLVDYDVTFRRTPSSTARENMTEAFRYSEAFCGREPECLTMVWPDAAGLFPWEPGCAEGVVFDQAGSWGTIQ